MSNFLLCFGLSLWSLTILGLLIYIIQSVIDEWVNDDKLIALVKLMIFLWTLFGGLAIPYAVLCPLF